MQTCTNCGNEVREGARFCASCGAELGPPEAQLSSNESPPPVTSPTSKRRLRWVAAGAAVALLVAGVAVAALSLTGGDESSQATLSEIGTDYTTDTTEPDLFGDPSDSTETDLYGDATDTTDTSVAIGQGVDETCDDMVAFLVLAREADIGRGGNSVSDVERVAAAAADLASKAPADSDGEPRDSFQGIAAAYETYLSVLSELGLEPGPDALLEPRIEAAFEDAGLQIALGIGPWAEEHCSQEVLDQVAEVVG
jgi:zinc-ribbon domain